MHYHKKNYFKGGGVSESAQNQVHTIDYKTMSPIGNPQWDMALVRLLSALCTLLSLNSDQLHTIHRVYFQA